MCWVGKLSNFRIATKDIPTVKVVQKPGIGLTHSITEDEYTDYKSLYFPSCVYKIGETKKSRIKSNFLSYIFNGGFFCIENGLHSVEPRAFIQNQKRYTPESMLASCPTAIVNCIIPKGSIYFKNWAGECVSNKLKIVRGCELLSKSLSLTD